MNKLILLALVAFAVCATEAQAAPTPAPTGPTISAPAEQPVTARGGAFSRAVSLVGMALFALGTVALGGTRTLRDSRLVVTKALPAAAATNYSDVLDTNTLTPGRIPHVELGLTVPATVSLVDAKTLTFVIQDSADGVTFAAVADLPPVVITGAGGVGADAVDRRFKLPITLRQYVRLSQTVLAAGGDNTALSSTLAFFF